MFGWDGDHLAATLGYGATALFTTRRGGVSSGAFASLNLGRTRADLEEDDPAAVARNRASVSAAAGGRPLRIAHQVHGTEIATDAVPLPDADGQVTARADEAVTVMVADCLPVAIAGPHGVAMLHAGWRGLAGGILARGAAALGVGAGGTLSAAIGPGIGLCCFAVGDDVRAAFAPYAEARRGDHVDLKAIARAQLRGAGVDQIEDCGLCTACDPERFFSHRRDQGRTGRQAGVAWLS